MAGQENTPSQLPTEAPVQHYPLQKSVQEHPQEPEHAPEKQPEASAEDSHHHEQWSSSMWDCFSPVETCLFGAFLPCCLFGKTQSRLQDHELKKSSPINGDCGLFALLTYFGCYGVYLAMKRGEIRKRFGIEGSSVNDCIFSCCCPCCVLVQHEKEVEAQSKTLESGYQAPSAMEYPNQI